jgi:hypothetical protein
VDYIHAALTDMSSSRTTTVYQNGTEHQVEERPSSSNPVVYTYTHPVQANLAEVQGSRGNEDTAQNEDNRTTENVSVRWSDDVVDNEHMGKRKSKKCCIYHKPRKFGEWSDSDSDSCDCAHDHT